MEIENSEQISENVSPLMELTLQYIDRITKETGIGIPIVGECLDKLVDAGLDLFDIRMLLSLFVDAFERIEEE